MASCVLEERMQPDHSSKIPGQAPWTVSAVEVLAFEVASALSYTWKFRLEGQGETEREKLHQRPSGSLRWPSIALFEKSLY